MPLVTTRGTPFLDGGTYFVTFVITVDATARIAVTSNYFLSDFETGVTLIDAALIPDSPASPVLAPHALTISGLPITAGASNFAGVYLFNTEGPVAACPDYTRISIISMGDEKAAVIPLVFDNNRAFNGQPFSDSGSFIVTFSFYPDALQSFIVTPENNCVVEFSGGSGSLDLRNVPSAPHKYLTVTHLPANTQELNITDVFVWNQAGKVAKCEDYSLLEFIRDGETTTLKIPLVYSADTARIFEETGAYFVSFDLNVDALTRILITEQERVLAGFIGGNATLDARTLPQALPVPYLTIVGLPLTTAKNNFSEVFLYNTVGKVAKCKNVMDIVISKSSASAAAMIPLVYNDNPAEYFRDSGEFIATFTINVDVNTQIIKTRDDALSTIFSDGSGFLDMGADRGYFSGELVNPNDMSPPVIKQGTVFEINGGYVQVKTNAAVTPFAFEKTCVAYVYAAQRTGRIEFIYSTVPPVFVPEKNAWYNGNNRALFKFVFVKDAVDRYVAKIPIDASWTPFERYTITNAPVAFYNLSQSYVLNGASNPAPVSRSFDAGWHLFVLTGAGGGGGGGIDGRGDHDRYGGLGGSGGFVAEIVYLPQTSVTLFTGSGGAGSDAIYYGTYQGGGGGGGGSGTFVYASAGYLLCAGGGGGGAGGSANDGGSGGGGAGGSCGPGAGGGMGGPSNDGLTIDGSSGGTGGGYGASTSAYVGYNAWANPANAATYQPGNAFGFNSVGGEGSDGGRAGANGGRAAYAQYNAPDDWKNTNNANGRGANGTGAGNGAAGSPGGNNRNAVCGTGAAGGAGGQPSDSSLSAGKNGGAGSIAVYAVQ